MRFLIVLEPFKYFSSDDKEDLIHVLRIVCGGALIAALFQMQYHGLVVSALTYAMIKSARHYQEEERK